MTAISYEFHVQQMYVKIDFCW